MPLEPKFLLACLVALASHVGFGQATHQISVAVNQPTGCPVVATLDDASLFQVFPNPASTFFTVVSEEEKATITLLDIQGRQIQRIQMGAREERIDVTGLPAGIYLLRLISGEKSEQIKIKIQ